MDACPGTVGHLILRRRLPVKRHKDFAYRPPGSPDEATCERLMGTLRREFLDRMLILNQAHLRAVLIEYQIHYNTARPHQVIAQRVPDGDREVPRLTAVNLDGQRIRRKSILNGLISEYCRAA